MLTNYPPYQNFPVLQSNEIVLRQVVNKDAPQILEISYYDGKRATHPDEATDMQNKINQDYEDGNSIHWGIFDVQSLELVGTCGYYRGFHENTGELGYILKPYFEGKGYMTKALKLAIEFGINTMGLRKFIAITEKSNTKSRNVLVGLNFSEEDERDNYITYTYEMKIPD